jgi:hypothetical protein
MLSGSLVTTAWRVLGQQMEETASRYAGQLQIIKQQRTAEKGWSSSFGAGRVFNNV